MAVMLVTLPGLPMFGHGQVEGFAEKYGMEYRRAYWDEAVDAGFVALQSQIFPCCTSASCSAKPNASNSTLLKPDTGSTTTSSPTPTVAMLSGCWWSTTTAPARPPAGFATA
ncbi:MAG: hypothetical protein R2864_07430 [Syntrophotaleaceae bacterium]